MNIGGSADVGCGKVVKTAAAAWYLALGVCGRFVHEALDRSDVFLSGLFGQTSPVSWLVLDILVVVLPIKSTYHS